MAQKGTRPGRKRKRLGWEWHVTGDRFVLETGRKARLVDLDASAVPGRACRFDPVEPFVSIIDLPPAGVATKGASLMPGPSFVAPSDPSF
ncbi:hypothetical protein DDF65_16535 [Caulobacter radicis]|uniref:Uncharacterized protein n=1 Tax=Caulobacter radicis TaxID=2172650 RepID=A0A2T9J7L9_9CAUL|nr:hypothetical protein DDF65_16535 [Caulobacter radicis]